MSKRWKRMSSLALALLLLLALLPGEAMAADVVAAGICGAQGRNLTWTLDSAGTLTISGSGDMVDYEYGGTPWGYPQVKRVVLESGVTSVGDYAFNNWKSLTSVSIADTVKRIGNMAFSYCYNLTGLTLPAGLESIGTEAFNNCTSLTSLTLPAGLTEIGSFAFFYCTSLTSLTLPAGLTEIGSYGFGSCTGLTSLTVPGSVTSMQAAFKDCTGLTSLTLSEGLDKVDWWCAFQNCTGLTTVTIPASVTSVDGNAFNDCPGITGFRVASGSESFCTVDGVLFNKAKTTLVAYPGGKQGAYTIPDTVSSIKDNAFSGCVGLTAVSIPSNFHHSSSLFDGCTSLQQITVAEGNRYYCSDGGILFSSGKTTLICYPAGRQGAYTIPNTVDSIGDYAFADCAGLTRVTITQSVTEICSHAFWNCTGLTSVTIPQSVTRIMHHAFAGCTGLTSITIPGSVGTLDYSMFENCTKLAGVVLGDGITAIGSRCFYNCAALKGLTIPSSVESIGDYAFMMCTGLESVTVSNGLRSIGPRAFYNCTALKSLSIPASVTEIGESAFQYCPSLTSVVVASSNPNYSSASGVLFDKGKTELICCPAAKQGTYVIPSTVKTIGAYAFDNCEGLTDITIPEGVTEIGDFAFQNCTGLSAVRLPSTIATVGTGAFANCSREVWYAGTAADWRWIDFGICWDLVPINLHFSSMALTVSDITPSKTSAEAGDTVVWTAKAAGGSGTIRYRFFVYKDGTAVYSDSAYNVGNTVSYTCRDAGTYTVRVYVRDDAGNSDNLNGGKVTVSAPVVVPDDVASITATASADRVTVQWPAARNAASYVLQRQVNGGSWATLSTAFTGTSYTDTDVQAGSTYRYRVRSRNGSNYGTFIASSIVTIASADTVPGAIASVTASAAPGKITVTWTAAEGAAQYIIQRRVKGADTWTTLKSNVTGLSYVDTTGEAGTVYQYRVRGRDGTSYGPFKLSSVVRAK